MSKKIKIIAIISASVLVLAILFIFLRKRFKDEPQILPTDPAQIYIQGAETAEKDARLADSLYKSDITERDRAVYLDTLLARIERANGITRFNRQLDSIRATKSKLR